MRPYVYFVRDVECNLIKIGFATHPAARIVSSRAFNPHRLILIGGLPGDRHFEKELHKRFRRASNYALEWFHPDADLIDFIRTNSVSLAEFVDDYPSVLTHKFKRLGCESLAIEWLRQDDAVATV